MPIMNLDGSLAYDTGASSDIGSDSDNGSGCDIVKVFVFNLAVLLV